MWTVPQGTELGVDPDAQVLRFPEPAAVRADDR